LDDAFDSLARQPFTLIEKNLFNRTQAYLSGNAIYMRSTRQRGSSNEKSEVCGAGITLSSNLFEDLTPIIQASNGGAVSFECDFVSI